MRGIVYGRAAGRDLRRMLGHKLGHFGQLFGDLVEGARDVGPIEVHTGRSLLQSMRTVQYGQVHR